MVEFKIIPFEEITVEDLKIVKKAIDIDPWHGKPSHLKAKLERGQSLLWRMTNGNARGVLITELLEGYEGPELLLSLMAGSGLFRNINYISETIEEFCKNCGIKRMRALTNPKVVAAVKELGWRVTQEVVEKEI